MLRRRLTLAFVLVAGVAAGALAAGAYLLVRDARKSDSLERAAAALRIDLRQPLAPPLTPADIRNVLAAEESRGQHAIIVARGRATPSNVSIAPALPRRLRARVATGRIAYERVGGARLLVGGRIPGGREALYLVVSER